jgi:hypothetical protein
VEARQNLQNVYGTAGGFVKIFRITDSFVEYIQNLQDVYGTASGFV